MDLSAIASALSSISAATDIAKGLKQADLSLEKADVKFRLAELIGALADTKMAMADVQDLVLSRDQEIKSLLAKLEIKDQLRYEAPYYWLESGEGKKDGPFCQQCHDNHQKLIRLQSGQTRGYWRCATCDQDFTDKSYNPNQQQTDVYYDDEFPPGINAGGY